VTESPTPKAVRLVCFAYGWALGGSWSRFGDGDDRSALMRSSCTGVVTTWPSSPRFRSCRVARPMGLPMRRPWRMCRPSSPSGSRRRTSAAVPFRTSREADVRVRRENPRSRLPSCRVVAAAHNVEAAWRERRTDVRPLTERKKRDCMSENPHPFGRVTRFCASLRAGKRRDSQRSTAINENHGCHGPKERHHELQQYWHREWWFGGSFEDSHR